MKEESSNQTGSLIDQLRRVVRDAIDYAASVLRLLQAQMTAMALSSLMFVLMIFFAIVSGLTAFVLVSIAFGIWLSHVTGSAAWSLLIIGAVYGVISLGLGGYVARWLSRLSS